MQWTRLYEPFGVKRAETKDSASAPPVPLGYAGEYNEPASGLYDLRARQYDPAVGRFLSGGPGVAGGHRSVCVRVRLRC